LFASGIAKALFYNPLLSMSSVNPPHPDSVSARFAFQLRMLEKGVSEIQGQIARLDDLLFKLKATFVTIWVAVIGWSATLKSNELISLALIVVLAFWMLEGVFRAVQARFIDRAREFTSLLNDAPTLDRCFQMQEFPPNVIFPVSFRESEWVQLRYYARGLGSPTVATLYLFIGFITYLLWLAQPLGS
jgi:hypothetical protein